MTSLLEEQLWEFKQDHDEVLLFTLFQGMIGSSVRNAYPAYIPLSPFEWNSVREDHVGAMIVMTKVNSSVADSLISEIRSFLEKDTKLSSLFNRIHLIPCSVNLDVDEATSETLTVPTQPDSFAQFCLDANRLFKQLSDQNMVHGMEMIPYSDERVQFVVKLYCNESIQADPQWYKFFQSTKVEIKVIALPNTFQLLAENSLREGRVTCGIRDEVQKPASGLVKAAQQFVKKQVSKLTSSNWSSSPGVFLYSALYKQHLLTCSQSFHGEAKLNGIVQKGGRGVPIGRLHSDKSEDSCDLSTNNCS